MLELETESLQPLKKELKVFFFSAYEYADRVNASILNDWVQYEKQQGVLHPELIPLIQLELTNALTLDVFQNSINWGDVDDLKATWIYITDKY